MISLLRMVDHERAISDIGKSARKRMNEGGVKQLLKTVLLILKVRQISHTNSSQHHLIVIKHVIYHFVTTPSPQSKQCHQLHPSDKKMLI